MSSMKKNAGYSLVELIVAIAVFAIAGISLFGFATFGTNNFKKSTEEVSLQYEQQLTVNQVRDLVLEANNALYFDAANHALIVYGQSYQDGSDIKYPATKIVWNQTEEKMYYGKQEFDSPSDVLADSISATKLLANYVTDFSVDLSKIKSGKVSFTIKFFLNGKEQIVNETVVLRNEVAVSNTIDDIFKGEDAFKDSFIKSIVIKRGDTAFPYAGEDVIAKSTSAVAVLYEAEIETTDESSREYAVEWSVKHAPTGITVDASTGIVKVASNVSLTNTFELWATCVEDATKATYIRIRIEGGGIYPESATVVVNDIVDGNGFREYHLLPTLYYDNGKTAHEAKLFNWYIEETLPQGCYFDKETLVFKVTESANDKKFTIYGISKESSVEGKRVETVPKLEITVIDVPEYHAGTSISIVCAEELKRAGVVYPTVVFQNATHTDYTYEWKIEEFFDATTDKWGKRNNSSFKLVSISDKRLSMHEMNNLRSAIHSKKTDYKTRTIAINCAERLYWGGTYKVKLTVTATENVKWNPETLVSEPVYLTIHPVSFEFVEYNYSYESNCACPVGDIDLTKEKGNKVLRAWKPKSATGYYLASDTWFFYDPWTPWNPWSDSVKVTPKYLYYGANGEFTFPKVNPEFATHNWATAVSYTLSNRHGGTIPSFRDSSPRTEKMKIWLEITDSYGNSAMSNMISYDIIHKDEIKK